MLGCVKPVRVFKRGVFRSRIFRFLVHHLHKTFRRPADIDSKRGRRVVAGAKHKPVQKLLNRQLVFGF